MRRLDAAGAEVHIIGKVALASGYGICSLFRRLRRGRFDVAITFLFVADVLGRIAAKRSGIPRIISSLRARNVNYSRIQRLLTRMTMNLADAIVINTSQGREFSIQEEGARSDRLHVILNGVNVENFRYPIPQEMLREKLALPKTGRLVGTVGRLTKQKGLDVLLQAFSLVSDLNLHLVIFGTGEDEVALRDLANRLRVTSQIHFAGFRRDIPELLGALDLYVHPARFEGMPNAVLEAMAAACPIVATEVDGTRELIEPEEHGWLVPPENPVALASAIREALADPDESRRRAMSAQRRVAEHFTTEKMIQSWEDILSGKRVSS